MLAELQAAVASALRDGAPPAGVDVRRLAHARRALVAKRSRTAAHLLPRLHEALGERWHPSFREHALHYSPCGLLHHVDDAWAFALGLQRQGSREVRAAASQDLRQLRARFVRGRRRDAYRIRPRDGGRRTVVGSLLRALRRS